VRDLQTRFVTSEGIVRAVDHVTYNVAPGETLGVVGESGSGKSVLALSLLRLIESPGEIVGGQICLHDIDLLQISPSAMEDYRGRKLAMIFQEPMTAFNPVLTIGRQIAEPLIRHLKFRPPQAHKRAVELLDLVGMSAPQQRADQYPHELSGGLRQRAMIAMALSCEPELLIADEPTTALDVTIQAQILELLLSLQQKFRMSIQFITHDMGVVSEIADRVMVMYAGTVCEIADRRAFFAHPRHPYSAALLRAVLREGAPSPQGRLAAIPGAVPSPYQMPTGCPFHPRCPRAQEDCQHVRPPLLELSPGHHAACFHPE
jgi:peptide/nickel transport system ATP-binding protein